MNLAIWITISRIALVPFMVLCILFSFQSEGNQILSKVATLLFLACGVSDFLDGYVARKYNQLTEFGKSFDPIADKIVVLAMLTVLLYVSDELWFLLSTLIILMREIVVTGLREFVAKQNQSDLLAVSKLGKIKTALLFVALSLILWFIHEKNSFFYDIGIFLLLASVLITILTMVQYCSKTLPLILKSL